MKSSNHRHAIAALCGVIVLAVSINVSAQDSKPIYQDAAQPLETRVDDLLSRLTLAEKISIVHADSKFTTAAIPRLGIPRRWLDDGPHGVREDIGPDTWASAGRTDDFATAMSAGICLAATWNPDLGFKEGEAIGQEARARGKDIMLGPGVNILRTPLCGRNFEYLGEDRPSTEAMKVLTNIFAAVVFAASCSAQTAEWVSSTTEKPWVMQKSVVLSTNRDDAPYDLEVRLDKREQTIDGWGGCFNELGWVALQSIAPEARDEVLRNLFAPGVGLNFTICRMPIGASDYATNWYSLDDSPGDFDLKRFSLDRDRTMLLPYIKAAMKFQPDLQVWGSPWSPPAWLKVNQAYNSKGTNQLIWDERHLATHANYLVKYVQAYRAEGVNVFAVAVQNEPFASQVFPSCVWTPEELRDFIGKYVGPTFKQEKVDAEIWLGTLNNNQVTAFETSLSDESSAKYISAVGLQWAGKNALPEINERYPRLKKIQTESECGDGSFDWPAAEYTFSLMKHYLNHGVNLYTYWNMILDDTGKSKWGWKQNALITVNATNQQVIYTPEFYLFKHFSHFLPKGSVKLESPGNFDDALAFLTPEGKLVVILANHQTAPQTVSAKIGGRSLTVKLPPKSFNTFCLNAPSDAATGKK